MMLSTTSPSFASRWPSFSSWSFPPGSNASFGWGGNVYLLIPPASREARTSITLSLHKGEGVTSDAICKKELGMCNSVAFSFLGWSVFKMIVLLAVHVTSLLGWGLSSSSNKAGIVYLYHWLLCQSVLIRFVYRSGERVLFNHQLPNPMYDHNSRFHFTSLATWKEKVPFSVSC